MNGGKFVFLIGLGVALTSASVASLSDSAGVVDGDSTVVYHVTATDRQGTILFTTDGDVAMGPEAPDGEDLLHNGGNPIVSELSHPEATIDAVPIGFDPSRHLLGLQAGDRITEWIEPDSDPITKVDELPSDPITKVYELPKEIGPVPTNFRVPLDHLYEERERLAFEVPDDPDELEVGSTWRYLDVLTMTVVAHDHTYGMVGYEINLPAEPLQVWSEPLGFEVRVAPIEGEAARVEPLLSVGDEVETEGCGLPRGTIPPGTYRVSGETPTAYLLEELTGGSQHLSEEAIGLQFEVLEVRGGDPGASILERWF